MKKLFFLILLIFNASDLLSQITIADYKIKNEEKIIFKPKQYDSLTNWKKFDDLRMFKQYFGTKIYLPKFSDKDRFGNRYCTITNVVLGKNIDSIWNSFDLSLLCDTCPKLLDKESNYGSFYTKRFTPNVLFQLKDDENGKLYYCTFSLLKHFILVPYFIKQQLLYKNKTLVYDDLKKKNVFINCNLILNDINNVVTSETESGENITKPKTVKLTRSSKWICSDVTLIKSNQIYTNPYKEDNYPDEYQFKIFYILKNNLNETIALKNLNPLECEEPSRDRSQPYCGWDDENIKNESNGFLIDSLYRLRERQRLLDKEELIKKQKQTEKIRKLNEEKEFLKKQNEYSEIFGVKYATLIAQKKICIDMSTKMCTFSWGKPLWIDKRTTANNIFEIWNYGYGTKLYFKDKTLFQIDE